MDKPWAVAFTLLLGAGLALAGPARGRGREDQNTAKKEGRQPEDALILYLPMQAVILSDNDGSNASGILSVDQLERWVMQANETYRASEAKLFLDFNKEKDIAHLKDSCLNRLNHDRNPHASAVAAQYPGKMVVFFRAYVPKKGSACTGNSGLTGNGYTAYNPYAPLGSPGCLKRGGKSCSASYVVMPSVFCNSGVGIDFADSKNPGPSVPSKGKDASGCPIFVQPGTNLIFIQNFNQLAHEVGHYFGLPHTFPGPSDALAKPGDLQNWYDGTPRSGITRSIKVFDGDSPAGPLDNGGYTGWTFTVTDTSPDAGAQIFVSNGVNMCNTPSNKTIRDGSDATVTFNGASFTMMGKDQNQKPLSITFTPEKGNVMSYFLCKNPMTFSPSQVKTMRNNLLTDPNRTYLLCADSKDADLRSYITCDQGGPASRTRVPKARTKF